MAGRPREYFQPEAIPKWRDAMGLPATVSPRDYLAALRRERSTPNGVFGAKIMRSHFDAWLDALCTGEEANQPAAARLAGFLPELRFVWMRRRDLVRQGISLVRAIQTGLWHNRHPDRKVQMEPLYDFEKLDAKVCMLQRQDDAWRSFFAVENLSPVEIVYEEFTADMNSCIRATLASLGIAILTESELFRRPLALGRQGDALNEEWAARYLEEKSRGRDTPDCPDAQAGYFP